MKKYLTPSVRLESLSASDIITLSVYTGTYEFKEADEKKLELTIE